MCVYVCVGMRPCVRVLCTCVRQVCLLHTQMQPYTRIHIHTWVQTQLARQTHRHTYQTDIHTSKLSLGRLGSTTRTSSRYLQCARSTRYKMLVIARNVSSPKAPIACTYTYLLYIHKRTPAPRALSLSLCLSVRPSFCVSVYVSFSFSFP